MNIMGPSYEKATVHFHSFWHFFSLGIRKSNGKENLILKTGRQFFPKDKKIISKPTDDTGLSYEKATVHFHIFLAIYRKSDYLTLDNKKKVMKMRTSCLKRAEIFS